MTFIRRLLIACTALFSAGLASAQDLPQPSLFVESGGVDGVQLAHSLSIRLRTNYCYHQFIMAYGGDEPLRDVSLKVHFGFSEARVREASLNFAQLGGTFIDNKYVTFGLNAPCQVDEFRVVAFDAILGEDEVSMGGGINLTTAYLTDLNVTQGLPINEEGTGTFGGRTLLAGNVVKCIGGRSNLRGGPSTSNVILATLQAVEGQREVTVLAEVSGGDWFEVQTALGRGFLFHTLLGEC